MRPMCCARTVERLRRAVADVVDAETLAALDVEALASADPRNFWRRAYDQAVATEAA